MQQTPDYQKGIRTRRRLNGNIANQYKGIMEKTVAQLRAYYGELGRDDPDFAHEFQIIHNNGDDINCMCNAELAFPFMDFFFGNLKDASIGEVDGQRIPLYCCGGICFMTEESDFHTAFTMAEKCCESAKRRLSWKKTSGMALPATGLTFRSATAPIIRNWICSGRSPL